MNIVKTNNIISKISNNVISSVVSLYMYTLGSLLMGFSIYLMLQTTNEENILTTWSGEAMFWSLIIFFIALFVLFFPIEFLNYPVLKNSNFSDLVINIFTYLAAKGHKIKVFGGDQYRPNVHVYDVANAIKLCLESPIKKVRNQIFNVGDNKLNLKIIDLAKIVSKLNKKSKVVIDSSLVDKRDY